MKRLLQQAKYVAIAAAAMVPFAGVANAETFIRANGYFFMPMSDDVLDNVFAGGVAVGETFKDDYLNEWQVELEGIYIRWDEKIRNSDFEGKFKSDQIPILLNIKRNFKLSNPNITIWLGPSIGGNVISSKISGEDGFGNTIDRDEDTTFKLAAGFGVGIGFRFSDSILANAGYRFFYAVDASIDEKTLEREDVMSNTFDVGLQYFF